MKCEHNDCYTCPYEDCISDVEVEPARKKPGRKPLPPEEKKKRIAAYNKEYNRKHRAERHERYMKASEGIVKRRYKIDKAALKNRICVEYCKYPEDCTMLYRTLDEAQEQLLTKYCSDCPLNQL